MANNWLKKLTRKSFTVPLEDRYCYPSEKNFVPADSYVMQSALENYAIGEGSRIEYLSKELPIRFVLNGKEAYEATLELGRSRFNSGYFIQCREIIEE